MAYPFDILAFSLLDASNDDDADAPSSPKHRLDSRKHRREHALSLPASLIVRIQAHEVEAFRELVRLAYAPLVQFSRSIVGSSDDAEDVVQDVFVSIWNLGGRWTTSSDPVAYLFASVRNHALNEVRRRTRAERRAQRAHMLNMDATADDALKVQGQLDAVIDAEDTASRIDRVTAILSTLAERQRTAYELRYRNGLSIAAIAEVLGVTVKSAEHLTARAARAVLERLRNEERPE